MIPSLVARELREVLLEYLSTTFALSEDAARQELVRFLTHPEGGVFRGPFLRVRTPLRQVPSGWVPPLDWLPAHALTVQVSETSPLGPGHPVSSGSTYADPYGQVAGQALFHFPLQAGSSVAFTIDRHAHSPSHTPERSL